jgi:hypothetical protein
LYNKELQDLYSSTDIKMSNQGAENTQGRDERCIHGLFRKPEGKILLEINGCGCVGDTAVCFT